MFGIRMHSKKILKNSGFKDIAVLSSGVLMAQVISLITQPIATRLYSTEAFGVISIVVSTVSMLTPILTLQYHMGIITAKTDKEADIVCALTVYTIMVMSTLTAVGLIIYNRVFPETFMEVGYWIYMSIPLLLLTGIGSVVDSYNNRFRQYKLMASVSLIRAVTSNILKIVLGFFKTEYIGLIISQFVSIVFGIKRQATYISTKHKEIFSSSIKEMRRIAVLYKAQPLFSMPGLFVTTYSYSILPIFINILYGIDETGYFSLSMIVLGMPLSLISGNVAKIFFRNATLEKDKVGNFSTTFNSTTLLLTLISAIGFIPLWFVAEPLFVLIFGNTWLRSGTFVKILIPMYAIRFILTALMYGFIISGKQFLKLILQCLFIIECTAIFIFAKAKASPVESFLGMVNDAYFINYVILLIVLFFTSRKIVISSSKISGNEDRESPKI